MHSETTDFKITSTSYLNMVDHDEGPDDHLYVLIDDQGQLMKMKSS